MAALSGPSSSFVRQLDGYRLTTAEITYHRPDHPGLLQQFIWQELDLAPEFPVLSKFLDFWRTNIEGRLHSVRIASAPVVAPAEYRMISELYPLN
jgi:uncharacterized protein Usg